MQKNVASQKLIVFAFDATTNAPKTGDAANLTAYVSIDYGAATVLGDTSATEIDATNAKGYYLFDLTQAETNGNTLLFSGKSTTANIVVIGVPASIQTVPANFSAESIDSNGRVDVIKIAGTTQTARDIGASVLLSTGTGTGQLDFTSGVVKANATQWLGGTIPAVNVTGVPLVDAKYLLGTVFSTPTVAGIPNVNAKTWNDLATVALPLVPTVAGRTLDVSVGGEAGLDWANVGSPTTTLALTGTTIATTQKVDIETIKTNPVVNAGTITFPTTATLASTTNITAAAGCAVSSLGANVITAASINAAALNGKGDWLLSSSYTTPPTAAANATAVWTDTTAGDFTTALSIGKSIMNGVSLGTGLTVARCTLVDTLTTYTGNTVQTGDSFARIGATGSGLTSLAPSATALSTAQWTNTLATNLGTLAGHDPGTTLGTSTLTQTQVTGGAYSVQSASCILGDARIAHLDADVSSRMATYTQPTGFLAATFPATVSSYAGGAVASVTGDVGGNVVGTVSGVTPATVAGILTTALTESYAADGAAFTLSQGLYMVWSLLAERSIASTTLTSKKLDGSSAMTFTLDSATLPTSQTRAT